MQTRREKILEAKNKELRLKEKTKVNMETKISSVKKTCPKIVRLFLSRVCLAMEGWGEAVVVKRRRAKTEMRRYSISELGGFLNHENNQRLKIRL